MCEGPIPCARRAMRSAIERRRVKWARGPRSAHVPGRALRSAAAARQVGKRARFRVPPERMPRRARRERGAAVTCRPSGVCVWASGELAQPL